MKRILVVIRKFVLSLCLLYSINLIIYQSGIILPINIFSIVLVTLLGIPAVFGLLILKLFIL